MRILVIGADGYMGWPLSCQLAAQADVKTLVLLDNCITREKSKISRWQFNHPNLRVRRTRKRF